MHGLHVSEAGNYQDEKQRNASPERRPLELANTLHPSLEIIADSRRWAVAGQQSGSSNPCPNQRQKGHHVSRRFIHSHIGMYNLFVPRAATTSDVFNAVAEPRRREILDYLVLQERTVGEIVARVGLEQPSVSKHLRVLHEVGLVRSRREGRQVLYRTNAEAIRPLHEWTGTFERYWKHQLGRVKERAEAKAKSSGKDSETK